MPQRAWTNSWRRLRLASVSRSWAWSDFFLNGSPSASAPATGAGCCSQGQTFSSTPPAVRLRSHPHGRAATQPVAVRQSGVWDQAGNSVSPCARCASAPRKSSTPSPGSRRSARPTRPGYPCPGRRPPVASAANHPNRVAPSSCARKVAIATIHHWEKCHKTIIRKAGGNESDIPELLSAMLRPLGWHETIVQGDLLVTLSWHEVVGTILGGKKRGNPKFERKSREILKRKFLDGHKIDYVKGKVAFDLEWNSKDQTFDRDLYAFSAFAQCGVIDVAVLVTRSESLNTVFRALGPALKRDGKSIDYKPSGAPRMTYEKYGASTTWMGKLLYRLNAGRNGGCPVLAVGITPKCISDWA